ncbi:MAG: TfoX/Sxy family protein [Alphaproteobacteria bacterium]
MAGMNHRVESEFVHYVAESLQPLGPVLARRMFGGHGLFLHDVMFGLIVWDTLYLKTDEINRPAYAERGLDPFTYVSQQGKTATMSYHEAPPESLDDSGELLSWAREAYAAALRALPPKGTSKKARTG